MKSVIQLRCKYKAWEANIGYFLCVCVYCTCLVSEIEGVELMCVCVYVFWIIVITSVPCRVVYFALYLGVIVCVYRYWFVE